MATKDVTLTVTMDEDQWRLIEDAAECAGMTVPDYLTWHVRLLAEQARPGAPRRSITPPRRRVAVAEESGHEVWVESFAERLGHRADPYRED